MYTTVPNRLKTPLVYTALCSINVWIAFLSNQLQFRRTIANFNEVLSSMRPTLTRLFFALALFCDAKLLSLFVENVGMKCIFLLILRNNVREGDAVFFLQLSCGGPSAEAPEAA